jgi:hypothetical protein
MASTLSFQIIKDIAEAEKFWKALSPNLSLFDDWDFRMCFHKFHQKELFFIVGYDEKQLVGLLPLQYNDAIPGLEFFAGSYMADRGGYMEDNRVFVKTGYEKYIAKFYDFATAQKKTLKLECITGTDPFTTSLPVQDHKFVLPLTFQTSDEYLDQTYSGETKKKLKKRIAKIAEEPIEILADQWNDIELMFQFNIAMFPDSSFRDRPYHQDIFREFLQPHNTFKAHLLTFVVNEKKQAVTLALIYKDTCYSMNRGFDPAADKNLREYVHIKKVEDALGMKLKYFDAMAGDYGWKERWGMKKIPQYEYNNQQHN